MGYKIAGHIESIVTDGKDIESINFVPDQEYTLIIDRKKHAVFVNTQKNKSKCKNLVFEKYIKISFPKKIKMNNPFFCIGKKFKLTIKHAKNEREKNTICIKADLNSIFLSSSKHPFQIKRLHFFL